MAYFPQLPSDFAPLFHLLDDYDSHRSCRPKQRTTPIRTFTPRFDVYEVNQNYYLNGELPGVNQSDIDIEFTDPHTLVIKGRVERSSSNNTISTNDQNETSGETSSMKSFQPTVEDEDEETGASSPSTPAETPKQVTAQEKIKPRHKYWVIERSVGEFHRAFNFSTRLDQDAVKASLKDGILSVIVPKEPAPTLKKIRVE
ncbi:HSP20-like chaperone [Aspergillus leporis]|jgi:HSP20 family molecular chaperone IbpA|uniref:HSP20-like chaperone n=1 Tax=Aspergillus leporis TaxID=41062 RepID=A0A5N5WSF6_9EURO|nr:HSP20-like chaperone [Aspergillus leporis]